MAQRDPTLSASEVAWHEAAAESRSSASRDAGRPATLRLPQPRVCARVCTCVYACMHAHVYAYTCVHACLCAHVCARVLAHVCRECLSVTKYAVVVSAPFPKLLASRCSRHPPQGPRTHDRETPRGEERATSSVSTHVTTPRRTRPARPACSEAGVGKDTPAPTLLPPRRTWELQLPLLSGLPHQSPAAQESGGLPPCYPFLGARGTPQPRRWPSPAAPVSCSSGLWAFGGGSHRALVPVSFSQLQEQEGK